MMWFDACAVAKLATHNTASPLAIAHYVRESDGSVACTACAKSNARKGRTKNKK
jgi:hypothetical protein